MSDGLIVGNEFAEVVVTVVSSPTGPRLLLLDRATGQSRFIDPLVLQTLVFMDDGEMEHLADPALVVDQDN